MIPHERDLEIWSLLSEEFEASEAQLHFASLLLDCFDFIGRPIEL